MARRDQSKRPPSFKLVIALGLFTAVIGFLLAVASLVSEPVLEVRELPAKENREPGVVYYLRGGESPVSQWQQARAELLGEEAGELILTEGDLNAWARSELVLRRRPVSADGEEGTEVRTPGILGLHIEPSGVNFRMGGERLQMAAYIEFRDILPSRKFLYQVRGRLVGGSNGLRFVPEEGTLGRAPLVQIPVLGGLFHRAMMGLLSPVPEWEALGGSLAEVREAEISEAGELHLRFD